MSPVVIFHKRILSMAKTGPKPTPDHALRLRGSGAIQKRVKPKVAPVAKPKRPRARVVRDLDKIIRTGIPGYNPYAQSGDCKFNPKLARQAIRFFETELCHVKGSLAGRPLLLEPWQQSIIGNLFGWLRKDGTRRYRTAFIFVPRKAGKTVLAAGIVAYTLFEDGEPGAEIYSAASEYKQATLVFEHVRGMVLRNPSLKERAKIYAGQAKSVQLESDYSTYRVVSSDASSQHGFNTHCYVVDEVHCLPDSELIDTLETSTGARRQPLGILISTSDYERAGSPCNAKHEYASRVRDGVIDDPSFLPVIYEASIDDDWTDPKVWAKANPNLGVSVSEEYIASACKKAQDLPRFENTFKRLHLNIRTQQDVRWLPLDKWDACAGEPQRLSDFAGCECWAGLDLATTRDLTALVLVFPQEDERFALVPIFWVPMETALERSRRDRVPYNQWIREGLIRTTPGSATDYATIRRDINALHTEHGIIIRSIAADRLFQGEQLCQELREQDGLDVQAFGQGFMSMAGPTKRFEDMVVEGKLRHGANPVLRWHASNVSVEMDAAGNIKPSRKKSTEKIDGIVAAIMGLSEAIGGAAGASVYNDRGIVWI